MDEREVEKRDEGVKVCPKCGHSTESWAKVCEKCFFDWAPNERLISNGPPQAFGILGCFTGLLMIPAVAIASFMGALGDGAGTDRYARIVGSVGGVLVVGLFVLHFALNRKK